MATVVVFFADEKEAEAAINQLALEASFQLVGSFRQAGAGPLAFSLAERREAAEEGGDSPLSRFRAFGFSEEQCQNCLAMLSFGKLAVAIECGDLADMLGALQARGIWPVSHHLKSVYSMRKITSSRSRS